jgi:hypothetical protein
MNNYVKAISLFSFQLGVQDLTLHLSSLIHKIVNKTPYYMGPKYFEASILYNGLCHNILALFTF